MKESALNLDDRTTEAEDEAQAEADFAAGAAMTVPPPETDGKAIAAKPEKPAAVAEDVKPQPKYVQVTEDQFALWNAAASKTAGYEAQLSKAFGTIGNLQKTVNGLQAGTPRGSKIEFSKDAFAELKKEFPQLGRMIHADFESALQGSSGTGSARAEIDPDTIKTLVTNAAIEREKEALEDAYPDWQAIVGAPTASDQQPNVATPFRQWLATKDQAYQVKIGNSFSATVLGRAIRTFQSETSAPAKPTATPKMQARTDRIAGAVQPKGDGGQPSGSKTDEEEFAAGFNPR